MRLSILYSYLTILLSPVLAGFPPQLEGVITHALQVTPGVTISYKETFICETQARAWAGYVHMPTSYLKDIATAEPYNLSLFFWYFEARNDPHNAPTTIYFAGGPGESSMVGATSDGGPCTVLEDANTTASNPFSFNTYSNMLYIDEPVSTGFSFTKLVNGTLDLLFLGTPVTQTGITPFEAYGGDVPAENSTFIYGTFSEQSPLKITNSTLSGAKALWHFSQVFFSSFPEYKTANKAVNVFGNSYGGLITPVFGQYTVQQNERISQGTVSGIPIRIETVGWTNGLVDSLVQGDKWPQQAYNNTYGLQVIPESVYHEAEHNFTKPDGCQDLLVACREEGKLYDPENLNNNATVNKLCAEALGYCFSYVIGPYDVYSNRSDFDMANLKPDPDPKQYWNGFFNRAWVQQALGVPVNLTGDSLLSNNVLTYETGDLARTAGMESVNYLLEKGVKVAMIYGDRDYRCPWNGGEKLSLVAEWPGAENFKNAGYEYVQTNSSYQGGVVRQYGNLSFTRVFQSGHDGKYRACSVRSS